MALLQFANLGLARPAIVMNQVYSGLSDFYRYLDTSRKALRDAAIEATWSVAKAPRRPVQSEAGVWIELDDPPHKDDPSGRRLREFFYEDVRAIYELVPSSRGRGWDWAKEHKIDVLGRDSRRGLLRIERLPDSSIPFVGLRPNTYPLDKQIEAVRALQDSPYREHRPIVDLFQSSSHVRWPSFQPEVIDEGDWHLLRSIDCEPLRPGTDEQRKFVQVALGTPDFAFLEGPPGSGKTTAICELILQVLRRGGRVLLSASTHVAVDNVIERMMDERNAYRHLVVPLRVGDIENVSQRAAPYQLENLRKTMRQDIVRALELARHREPSQEILLGSLRQERSSTLDRIVLDSANLVCGTTIGILKHPDIRESKGVGRVPVFDLLIVDEASKTTFQEFLVPALFARRWILVGDPMQLSPYVEEAYFAANVDTLLPEPVRNAALDCFDSARFSSGGSEHHGGLPGVVVLAADDAPELDIYRTEAGARNMAVVDLRDGSPATMDTALADLVLGTSRDVEAAEESLPLDIARLRAPQGALRSVRRRIDARLERLDEDDERTFGGEIGWRLARAYEKRRLGTDAMLPHYRQVAELLPKEVTLSVAQSGTSRLQLGRDILRIRRIALPSVLESLQEGFERPEGQRQGTALTDGIPPADLRERHVPLTWQHRMHPQIAAFPSEAFYGGARLKTSPEMASLREWANSPWPRRVQWIDVKARRNEQGSSSEDEAIAAVRELERFRRWTQSQKRLDGGMWEVAVLTFYRAQERVLRDRLRKDGWDPGGVTRGLQLELCTVDRFQGHEADLVLLSFGRSRGVGFLDSPNRLNVAVTRARYQLILIGNRHNFERQRKSEHLSRLAQENVRAFDIGA